MHSSRKLIGGLLLGLSLAFWAALPGSATASTVADVCGTAGNTCAGGVANINVTTTVTCPSTLDFETAGVGKVNINAGGVLQTTGAGGCILTLNVETLTVKTAGIIRHQTAAGGNAPAQIFVNASAGPPTNAIVVEVGGAITNVGGAGLPHPLIDLEAVGNVIINGLVRAEGITAGGRGGNIFVVSTEGKVTIGTTGQLITRSQDYGGDLIQIEACAGIDMFGLLDSKGKINGSEIHLFSREFINIINGTIIGGQTIGTGFPGSKNEVTIEARGTITMQNALITTDSGGTNAAAGKIDILSTEEQIVCSPTTVIRASNLGAGSNGGPITLRSFDNLTYNCTIRSEGNTASGKAGAVLLQSFNGDVIGPAGNVQSLGLTNKSITLTSCKNPMTNGGTFNPNPPTKNQGVCVAAPTSGVKFNGPIPPCTGGCPCITKFSPTSGPAGTTVTIKGTGLKSVSAVHFHMGDCDLTGSTPATITGPTPREDGTLLITVPAGLQAGQYRIIAVGPTGTFCTTDLFTTP